MSSPNYPDKNPESGSSSPKNDSTAAHGIDQTREEVGAAMENKINVAFPGIKIQQPRPDPRNPGWTKMVALSYGMKGGKMIFDNAEPGPLEIFDYPKSFVTTTPAVPKYAPYSYNHANERKAIDSKTATSSFVLDLKPGTYTVILQHYKDNGKIEQMTFDIVCR